MNFTGVTGESQLPATPRLRSAELGKHKALLASIVRLAATADIADYERAVAIPYRLLALIEASAPEVVGSLLASPQFGAWADDCYRRLTTTGTRGEPALVPLASDLGHLGLFAATAAMRTGHPFQLEVPLRGGIASFPAFGTAQPGETAPWEWAQAWNDNTGCRVRSTVATVEVPGTTAWSPLPRIVATERGLRLDVVLDDSDPFLDRYGGIRVRVTSTEQLAWRDLLAQAWRILAQDHFPLAEMIAATIHTLVPLARPGPTRSAGATEIASFGAIALSLPADALSMAEALTHEAHHAVLSALIDIEPLVREKTNALVYAPWRDDPRPDTALLQGIYAHYGMGRFWSQRYRTGPPAQRLRAAAEFGRMRDMAARATVTLAGSGALTEAGRDFLAGIQAELRTWLDEPLPSAAADHAADIAIDHEVRWRLSHLVPEPEDLRSLADAWCRADRPPLAPGTVTVRLVPGPLPPSAANTRSYLLTLRHRMPELLHSLLDADGHPVDEADAALIRGEYEAAASGYLRRIAHSPDTDAWGGLAIARRHSGPGDTTRLLACRPEILAALHERLHGMTGATPDNLAGWLAGGTP